MRTFASFEYVLVGKLPNRRIIRRKTRSCDSGIISHIEKTGQSDLEIFFFL